MEKQRLKEVEYVIQTDTKTCNKEANAKLAEGQVSIPCHVASIKLCLFLIVAWKDSFLEGAWPGVRTSPVLQFWLLVVKLTS